MDTRIRIFLIFILLFFMLFLMTNCQSKLLGKPVWPCPYNENRLRHIYVSESSGKYTSQSVLDPYSLTHVSHGILLFYILYLLHDFQTYSSMIYIAIIYEVLWEIIENTPFIIRRYREQSTQSREYHGDSIVNSLGDIFSMTLGFFLAWTFPRYGILCFIFNEMILYHTIGDNLLTNIYQLFIKPLGKFS